MFGPQMPEPIWINFIDKSFLFSSGPFIKFKGRNPIAMIYTAYPKTITLQV
jgi:hypothetical protein